MTNARCVVYGTFNFVRRTPLGRYISTGRSKSEQKQVKNTGFSFSFCVQLFHQLSILAGSILMASSSVNPKKHVRMEPGKSHSWWWDSHISPKNSKWLAENLEDVGQNVKQMLKLIEEDGDSFAKKVEMYYKKRPELVAHVEELFRMYRLLAERYDHLTVELRRNIPSDLHSQGSVACDLSSEPTSPWHSPDPKMSHRRSGHRAAGFEYFLGSGESNSDLYGKGNETSSLSDSETESDVSSVHNYSVTSGNNGEEGLQGKMIELEVELKMAREKIHLSEEEIATLKMELKKFSSLDFIHNLQYQFPSNINANKVKQSFDEKQVESIPETEVEVSDPNDKVQNLVVELRITKGRLWALEKEVLQLKCDNKNYSDNVCQLQGQLKMAQKDAAMWKAKVDTEKRQVSKMQERIARYKNSLNDRENEVRELKEVISDASRKYQLHAEISRLQDEKTKSEEKLREWEVHFHSVESQHRVLERTLNDEIEKLTAAIEAKRYQLESLNEDLVAFKLKYGSLMRERDELNAEVLMLSAEVGSKNNQIDQLDKQLEYLTATNEGTCKVAHELKLKVEGLKVQVEKQKVLILEGAEEKREAIRQLCFSLEHYRNGYHQLRQAFTGHKQQALTGHKRLPVFAP
ncbi:hypothetical protein Nepgr_014639 [Nepenthes gracilis]|uniref:NAB domain-containing protein n=1 Tax=Nepenthes gracilis TaxID=150966 RepID=A0AAD3SJW1_NEPGR|nr:hypothetical protein Nepgr_014639 [Nepenthes gracilis]